MNENYSTNLHMTADVWNALVDMMNVDQLDNFIETLEFAQDKFISNEVITNADFNSIKVRLERDTRFL